MIDFDEIMVKALFSLMIFMIGISLILFFVYLPAAMVLDRKCLMQGYPKAYLTYKLEGYCANLEGVVTIKVEPQ